jgi:hypothetical protein
MSSQHKQIFETENFGDITLIGKILTRLWIQQADKAKSYHVYWRAIH